MRIIKNPAGRKALANLFSGVSVELGTERGKYAEILAQHADKLYVVDLWKSYDNYRTHVDDDFYESILQEAHQRLDKYNVGFIREDTVKAAELFEDNSIDAIYFDANHTYPFLISELNVYWSKIKSNGIVAGHDFSGKHKDVRKAVIDFATEKGIEEITEWCGDRSHSFHFVKP